MSLSSAPPARALSRVSRAGPALPGFAGPGHTAVEVFGPSQLGRSDPFVLLMDDRLDFRPGQPVGEAHPHAGLETVTLMLEGSLDDPAFGRLEPGDLEWMNAGRGIIHGEGLRATGYARILQLWIGLPPGARSGAPDLQIVPLARLPIRREPGVEARLYSGRTGELISPTRNRTPVTLVDFILQPGASVRQVVPAGQAGLLYVISGALTVEQDRLTAGAVGWFDGVEAKAGALTLQAGAEGGRVVLYAGAPIREPLVQRGPFVAGSPDELAALYRRFRSGAFDRLGEIARQG